MRQDSRDRIDIGRTLADTRLDARLVYILIPTFASVSFDADTQSGVEVSTGDGTGVTPTWETYGVRSNIRNVDTSLIAFGHVPPGVQAGDLFITVSKREETIIRRAYAREHSYCLLDGETFRITSIDAAGVGQIEEWVVSLKKYNPLHRRSGY